MNLEARAPGFEALGSAELSAFAESLLADFLDALPSDPPWAKA